MVRLCALLFAVSLGVGCTSSVTLVRLSITVTDGGPPVSLAVSVYDRFSALVHGRATHSAKLPGTLLIDGLPAVTEELRIAVDSDPATGELGGTAVQLNPNHQITAQIALSQHTPDDDHDGVPNDIDNCPSVFNPDQADMVGDGTGDDCRGTDTHDLAGLKYDLAGLDFSPPPIDLARPQDLATTLPKDMAVKKPDMAVTPKPDMAVTAKPDMAVNPCAGMLLCDTFESGVPNAAWTKYSSVTSGTGTPTITVDSTHAYRGTKALHVHFPSTITDGAAWLAETAVLPATPRAFIRAHFYVGSGFAMGGANLIQAIQDTDNGYAIRLRMDPWDGTPTGDVQPGLGFEEASNSSTGSGTRTPYSVPLNKWFCAELEIDQNATPSKPGVVATYFTTDGTPEPAATNVTDYSMSGPPYPTLNMAPTQTWVHEIDVGPYFTAGTATDGDMWIDDIAISTSRIFCND